MKEWMRDIRAPTVLRVSGAADGNDRRSMLAYLRPSSPPSPLTGASVACAGQPSPCA
jgi:hypothetical protein